jgi:ABC-type polysaccharide/polyol phosphate transport system ATPase subunit
VSRQAAAAPPEIAEDVVLSLQGVSKRPPNPPPNPPRWLARFLPGVQWSATAQRDDGMDDDPDEDADDEMDDDPDVITRLSAIRETSFDLAAGSALGLVGPDTGARRALLWMIAGFVPPATGRILIRGHVAPIFNAAEINITRQTGKRAIKLAACFFNWPWKLIESRWDEIEEFARIHEITQWPEDSVEYEAHRTKRLLLSSIMHMDASVYLVGGNFYAIEPEFVARCHALLEQRLREGCAVIHSIGDPENLATFCSEAIYIDNGRALFRGRLGEVAKYAHERPAAVQPGAAKLPIRASLFDEGPVRFAHGGGTIEIELDVFTKRLELTLGVLLVDEEGRRVRIEAPEHLTSHRAGIYTLRLELPDGVVPRGSYKATLAASLEDDPFDEESEAHTLLSFEFDAAEGPAPSTDVVRITDEASWSVVEGMGES